jgi:hypothetical protein
VDSFGGEFVDVDILFSFFEKFSRQIEMGMSPGFQRRAMNRAMI